MSSPALSWISNTTNAPLAARTLNEHLMIFPIQLERIAGRRRAFGIDGACVSAR